MSDLFKAIENIFGGVDIAETDGTPFAQTHGNIFGGMDAFHNGQLIDHATPNVFGGMDHHEANGMISHSTHPNIFGGVDITDPLGHVMAHTQPNIFGGENIFDGQNTMGGEIIPDPNGFHARFFK